mmetsp:Transcript_18834/g.43480  ORF Transcript_18834/g.43480 Transcript_18834/m.43480 type:complete len:449 (+) Transcript_18834:112-1458(+)
MFASAPGHPQRWPGFRPAVLMLLVCSCSCTPAPAPQNSFPRASSSESGRNAESGKKAGGGGVTSASVGRANSFPTAFVRTRVGVKRKSIGGENKASAIGQRWAVATRDDVGGSTRVPPVTLKTPAHPLTTTDGRAGGLRIAATSTGEGLSEINEVKTKGGHAGSMDASSSSFSQLGGDTRNVCAPGARRFMLLRHGQTNFNAEGRVQGSSDDSRLSDFGVRQAAGAGAFLKDFNFEKTYVSPLNRARETLRIVAGDAGDAAVEEAVVDDDLREIDLYEWQGMLKHDIKTEFPDDFAKWRGAGAATFRLPSGNYPVVQLWARARKVWERLLAGAEETSEVGGDGDGSLIVAHNAVIQAMLCTAMGLGEDSFRKFQVPNCGVVEVEWVPGEAMARRWRWRFPTEDAEWNIADDYLGDKQSGEEECTKEILGKTSLRVRSISMDGSSEFPS